MIIERVAAALGLELPKTQRPGTRTIAFAVIGGLLFGGIPFVLVFVATAVIWPSAQGPLLAFVIGPLGFTIGTVAGMLEAQR
jgi:hypothetical protein